MDNETQGAPNTGGGDAQAEINRIEATPGYLIEDSSGALLKNTNHKEYTRLNLERDAAYNRLTGESEQEGTATGEQETTGIDMGALQTQSELMIEATQEMATLVGLGFEEAEVPTDIEAWKVDSLKMQRMTAQENYTDLIPLVAQQFENLEASDTSEDSFNTFIRNDSIDPELKQTITMAIVNRLHEALKQQHAI